MATGIPTEETRLEPVAVVMVPFPAQGHLNQLLHFSRILAARGLTVHIVGSATHNRQAKLRVHGLDPLSISMIHFHDLSLPSFPNPPPDPHAPIKFPSHLQPAFEACAHLRQPFAALLRSLSGTARRLTIVHDTLMSFAAQEAQNHPNAESYAFPCISAFALFFAESEVNGQSAYPSLKIPELPPLSTEGCFTRPFIDFMYRQLQMMASTAGHIYNTCRPIEGEYIDLVAQGPLLGKRLWAVGPMNPIAPKDNTRETNQRHRCLEWLDKQPPKSVVYVSFGTMSSLSDEQIHELAMGLERSEQRFVWVVREADRGDIFAREVVEEARKNQLPEGYEKRVEQVGIVVRDWAPQIEILGHPSVGGFMTHCGWNSCMESMSMGVPMAAWPMHSDQPRNAMLVTEVLKIGVMVREWTRREETVMADAVEYAVRKLMGSEEAKEMRKRAEELGSAVRHVWNEGGSSLADLDSFISHISRE